MYYALIESHLRYADVIWGNQSKAKLAALQRLQDPAYLIISNARIKDSWSTSWLNVENLFRYDRTVMTYKIMKTHFHFHFYFILFYLNRVKLSTVYT